MEWIQAIAAVASGLAAVLAWVAKIRWSNEFAAAKDEIIRAKDAQIETLKERVEGLQEMTPMKIREYFVSVTKQLGEYNDKLQEELEALRSDLQQKDGAIASLQLSEAKNRGVIDKLSRERNDLRKKLRTLESEEKLVSEINEKFAETNNYLYFFSSIMPNEEAQLNRWAEFAIKFRDRQMKLKGLDENQEKEAKGSSPEKGNTEE